MPFDRSDIRPMMDVYTHDNVYLGNVLAITPGPQPPREHETAQGAHVQGHASAGSVVSGELLGPMPTQTLGNKGPFTQSAAKHYASEADDAQPLGEGSITVGKWYGLLGKRTIPLSNVQTVSLERVVLRRTTE